MERRTTSALLPAMLLAMLLLLASELTTLSCGHRTLRADVAARRKHARATTAAAPPSPACRDADEAAVFGESKRLVPQGSNPLHN
jgi:hypothetical protein